MSARYLAVQRNTDGRPCGWALSADPQAAKAEAGRQYDTHECYPGELRGILTVEPVGEPADQAQAQR